MLEEKCRKVYVPVNLDVDADGNIRPRLIRWIDGRVYEIDRLKHKCQLLPRREVAAKFVTRS